jgi:hypothetical protein
MSAYPTCHPLYVCFGGVASGVLWNLLELFLLRISVILFDILIPLVDFLE